jgi:5-methylcytosine-specific restriction endonuclease McrA
VSDFTAADWRAVLEDFNHACAYCLTTGVLLEQEHMTPLSRGGSHTRTNIVPACGPCNRSKGTRDLIETLQMGAVAS